MKKKISVKAHVLQCIVGLLFLTLNAQAQLLNSSQADCNTLVNYASEQIVGHGDPSPFCDFLQLSNLNRRLTQHTNCITPPNLAANAVNSDIQLTWSDVVGAVGYLISYQNLVTGLSGQVQSSSAAYTLSSLPPGVYIISVQTMCDGLMLSAPAIVIEAVIITDIAMIRSNLNEKICGCILEDPIFEGMLNKDELILGWDDECTDCPSNLKVTITTDGDDEFNFNLAYAYRMDTVSIASCSGMVQNPVVTNSNQSIEVSAGGKRAFIIRFSESVGMVIDQFEEDYKFDVTLQRCRIFQRETEKTKSVGRNAAPEQSVESHHAATHSIQTQPNPFNNSLQIQYTVHQEGAAALRLYDYSGKVVIERFLLNQQKGNHQLQLDTSKLPTGLYFLSYESTEGKTTQTILKTQ
ncbi:MAG: T9SS type A sorting domain-containing protein [Bacteroidota bacterium]